MCCEWPSLSFLFILVPTNAKLQFGINIINGADGVENMKETFLKITGSESISFASPWTIDFARLANVIVEGGNIISFVAYINSGHCKVYRTIVGLVKQQSKVKKIRKCVYVGKLKEKESFGEISVLLQIPFTCTVVAGNEVELAIIDDKDLFGIDPVTKQLMIQTAQPTFGHLTEEDVKNEFLQKEKQKEWKNFKDSTVKNSLYYNGIVPDFGKWNHYWTTVPRNLKDTLVTY